MNEVRIGLIGLGGMSRWHMKNLLDIPGVRISAICDVSDAALAEVGEQLGLPEALRLTDVEPLIRSSEVDGVVAVTPNDSHARIIELCIRERKPLLTEKPLTRTFAEAESLLAMYRANPIPLLINFSYRHGPAFQLARRYVKEGRIGRINHLFVQYLQDWGSTVKNTPFLWRFDRNITGTGTLGDLGSHMLDLAEYVTGRQIVELQSMLHTIVPERPDPLTGVTRQVQVDDFVCINARFDGAGTNENGAANSMIGVFHSSRNALGSANQHEITLYGELGTLHASTLNDRQLIWTHPADDGGDTVTESIDVPQDEGLNPWREFVSRIRGAQADPAFASFEDGYRNQRLLDAVVRAGETRTIVSLA